MKIKSQKIGCLHLQALFTWSALCILLATASSARAASATWLVSPFNNVWTNTLPLTTNWSTGPGTFPGIAAGATGTSDVATFNTNSSITTIFCTNSAGFNLGGIVFDTPNASAYTIINTGPGNGSWRLNTGSATVRMTSTVINKQTITGQIRQQSSGTTFFINDSTTPTATLNITGGVSVNNSGTGGALFLGGTNIGLNIMAAYTEQTPATIWGALIKTNVGTWVLTGNNTYHSNTIVAGGTLILMGAGAFTNTPNIIVNNATLSISNSIVSPNPNTLFVTNSGVLLLTNTFFRTPVTIGTLVASNAIFHLGVNGSTPFTNIVAKSALNVGPGITLAIDQAANIVVPTTFALISYAGADPDPADFTVTVPAGYSAGAVTVAGNGLVTVTITPPAAASSLVWVGATNSVLVSNWDTTTRNWVDAATLSFPQAYANPDSVLFDDTASNSTVTLSITATPFGVVVNNNTLNYTFNGGGKISGAFGFLKQGSASLTLAETGGDNFSGGLTNNGGMLLLDNTNSTISGGLTIANGATVQIGNNDGNGTLPLGSVDVEGALIFSRSNNIIVSTSIFGAGSLTQNGNGTLTLNNTNSYSGNTVVSEGTLALTGSGSVSNSPALLVSNATFDVSGVSKTTTLLNDLNITNGVLNVGSTNLQPAIATTTFETDGVVTQSNIINVLALPPIASYPVTLTLIQSVNPITLSGNNFNFALGSLPPTCAGSLSESADGTTILLTLTAGPVGTRPSVTWIGTNNVSATTNWSDRLNWQLPGAPVTADNVFFDNSTTVGNATTINNVVDANFTVAGLSYINTNGQFQVTQIPAGVTLTVNSNFTVGGLVADGAVSHVAFTDGGMLVVNATNPNLVGNSGVTAAGGNASLDLSGLSYFIYNASSSTFGVGNIGGRGIGMLNLAAVSNNITAGTVAIMTSSASSSVSGSTTTTTLGAGTNIINANTINIAATRASGTLKFPTGSTTGGLRVRGTAGTDASRATMVVGNRSSGGTSGTATGTLSLNDNSVDMKISTLTLGQCNQVSPVAGTGTLQFNQGTVDATTINMAINTTNGSASGMITVGANGVLVIGSGGLSPVNNDPSGTASGTLTISGGTVISSNGIVKTTAAGTGNISLTDGTLNMVAGTIGTLAAPIDTLALSDNGTSDTKLQLNVAVGVTNIAASTITTGGITTININSLNGVVGTTQIPLISYSGTTPFSGLALGTIPAGYTGASLVDNTVNQTIDIIVTPPAPLVWVGAVGSTLNGSWDTNTLNWLNGATPSAYADADFVQFDDTASNGVVTLTTTVSPAGFNLINNALNYTFNGSGKISGTVGLVKQGTGTLVLDNSGTNDFSGGINIVGGTVQIGNNDANGNLPLGNLIDNGNLTFSRTNNLLVANTISGSGGVSQVSSNIVTLSGVNSYGGNTFISTGTIKINNTNALGSWSSGVVTITNGGTLDVGGLSVANLNPVFAAKQFNIAGAGVGGNGAIINSGANAEQDAFQQIALTADATFGGSQRWDMRNNTPLLDLAGFTLTKTSTNQISLVSPHVTSGNIVINQGILSFESTPNFDASAGTITVNSGGYLGQFRDVAGSFTRNIVLNGGGTTNLSGATGNTIVDAPILLTTNSTLGAATGPTNSEFFNGVISDNGGGFGLTKSGAAPIILSANSTYSGGTIVGAGTLVLSGNGSISNSATITVATGATFDVSGLTSVPFILNAGQTLNGFGTVTGAVTTASGSAVAPGSASAIGVLIVQGNVALGGTSTFKVSKSTIATNDILSVNGTLAVGGPLNVSILSGTLAVNDTFTLFNASGGISGAFTATNLPSPGAGLGWDTSNLGNGVIKVIATSNPTPHITSILLSGTNLVFNATNGLAGAPFNLLTSTNVALPLSQWTTNATGAFDSNGNIVNFTNGITPNTPQQFYILSQ